MTLAAPKSKPMDKIVLTSLSFTKKSGHFSSYFIAEKFARPIYSLTFLAHQIEYSTFFPFQQSLSCRDFFWCPQGPKFGPFPNGNKVTFFPNLKKKFPISKKKKKKNFFFLLEFSFSHHTHTSYMVTIYYHCPTYFPTISGAQFEGDLGEILALGAEILPYIGLREKWESPYKKKKKKKKFFFFCFFLFLSFYLVCTP